MTTTATNTTSDDRTLDMSAAGPKYPYRVGPERSPEQVRAAIDEALQGVDSMIYSVVRRRLAGQTEANVQELAQRCRIHLWTYSLPRFDAHRTPNVKVSTFLHCCISRFVSQEVRSESRARYRCKLIPDGDLAACATPAPDESNDRAIEAFVARLAADPEKYLPAAQAKAFRTYLAARPGAPMREMCHATGHVAPASLCNLFARLRQTIIELAIKEGVLQ